MGSMVGRRRSCGQIAGLLPPVAGDPLCATGHPGPGDPGDPGTRGPGDPGTDGERQARPPTGLRMTYAMATATNRVAGWTNASFARLDRRRCALPVLTLLGTRLGVQPSDRRVAGGGRTVAEPDAPLGPPLGHWRSTPGWGCWRSSPRVRSERPLPPVPSGAVAVGPTRLAHEPLRSHPVAFSGSASAQARTPSRSAPSTRFLDGTGLLNAWGAGAHKESETLCREHRVHTARHRPRRRPSARRRRSSQHRDADGARC